MKLIRFIAIILSLSLEIRVKAAPREEPVDCILSADKLCSLFAFSPSTVHIGKGKLNLAAGTILFRDKQKKWNFLEGTLRIESVHTFELLTRMGGIKVGPGVAWVKYNENRLWVYTISGLSRVELSSTAINENLVPEGFYNWFGLIDKSGESSQGMPRRITVTQASSFLPGFRNNADTSKITKVESRSIAMASEFYHDVAQGMQDAYVARVKENEQRIENKKKLDQSIRSMFRQKYFSPVDLPSDGVDSDN